MNDQEYKNWFEGMKQALESDPRLDHSYIIVTKRTMMNYIEFILKLLNERVSADQERKRNEEQITPDQAPRLNYSEWW
jgi:hypothetical protein